MLNNLQHQAYKVNPLIFAVADHFYDSFTTVGKFNEMLRCYPREHPD